MHIISKVKNIYFRDGLRGLMFRAIKILRGKNNLYTEYNLDYTPLSRDEVLHFVKQHNPCEKDLVVVPTVFLEKVQSQSNATTIDTLRDYSLDMDKYERLIWATERCDRGALTVAHFYKKKKKVTVLQNFGPARSWMHDQAKEIILKKEYSKQTQEGIEKFSHGIGADFGNLLQFIDNTKHLNGEFVEIGCFKGSSACVIASYLASEKIKKDLYIYDYFSGFTFPEVIRSIDSNWENTHATDGISEVKKRILERLTNDQKLHIFKRNIIDAKGICEVDKVALANIDVDLYESVYAALHHVHKKLVINGIMVVEDAGHTPALIGATLAVNQFLDDVGRLKYCVIRMESGQYVMIRNNE